ncbi:MAG: PQQ-binding-like beta-propeller repeat protein [Dictyoglomus thermophilum]
MRRSVFNFLILILLFLFYGCAPKDTQPPTVSILSPADGETVSKTITITVEAIDDKGISKVELYIDSKKIIEKTKAPYTYTWDTTQYDEGLYLISAKAIDLAGNSSISKIIRIFVSNMDKLKWAYQTEWSITSSPAIGSDGTIYVGDWDRYLYAINPDGTLKWKYETEDRIHSSPAIGQDGTIYVGSEDGNLYAINPDGTLKWKYKTENEIHSSPAIGPDGTIYVGSNDHNLYAINPDGTLKWKYETEDHINSSPAIGSDETIYVGSWDNYLYAINPDGTLKWKYKTGDFINSSPTLGNKTVYVGSDDGYLYAINSTSYGLAKSVWPKFRCNYQNTGYLTQIADSIPPTVSITYPTDGATLTGTITIEATATDNLHVSRVEFYIDDELKYIDNLPPYAYTWNTNLCSNGEHTLMVKAYDEAENKRSISIRVNVNN